MVKPKISHTSPPANQLRRAQNQGSPSRAAIFLLLVSMFCVLPVAAQRGSLPVPGSIEDNLRRYVETPSVPGYEGELAEEIRAKISAFHPVTDNLGDVIVTIGSGAPHRTSASGS